jgi:hypothetical protein
MPKFAKTFCSQCGQEFGPGDHGFSHCSDHQGKIMYSDGTMSSKTPNAVEGNGEQDQLPPMPRFVSDEHDARYEFSVPRTTYEDLRDEYVDLRAKAQALQEQLNNRVVRVRDLIRLLESSASNTDTDWRWQAATALRQCVQWESAEIPLARKR